MGAGSGKLVAAAIVAVGVLLSARRRRRRQRMGWRGGPGPPPSGVREPRRPLQPAGSGAAEADPAEA